MKKGFTLIELLVVIAIIAILSGIIFPVFSVAREKARTTQCMSNLKQLCLATIMYTDDYNKYFPPSRRWDYSINAWSYWTNSNIIYPYVKNREIYFCPNTAFGYDKTLSDNELYQRSITMNYGSNSELMPATNKGYKYTKIKVPGNIVIFMDASYAYSPINFWKSSGGGNFYLPGCGIVYPKQAPANQLNDDQKDDYKNGRHNGGVNIVYCDAHTEWKKSEEVMSWLNLTKQNPMLPKSW